MLDPQSLPNPRTPDFLRQALGRLGYLHEQARWVFLTLLRFQHLAQLLKSFFHLDPIKVFSLVLEFQHNFQKLFVAEKESKKIKSQ